MDEIIETTASGLSSNEIKTEVPKKRGKGRPRKVRVEEVPDNNPFKNEMLTLQSKISSLEEQLKAITKENDTLRLFKVTLEQKLFDAKKRIMALENKWEE